MARLTTDFWVYAYLARLEAAAIPAFLTAKGDPTAGAVLVKVATMDGRALTRPRTFGTWSVDGMFETLQRDLDTNEVENNLMLGAVFDETYGYPLRYERVELRTGVHDSLQWEVTRFAIKTSAEQPAEQPVEQQAGQP